MGLGTARAMLSARRLGQFLSVGLLGAVVDTAVLVAAVEAGVLPVVAAAVLAKETSILVMFGANERWTFAEVGREGVGALVGRCVRSHAVRVVGAAVGIAVLVALTRWASVWYPLANALGIGTGFVFNYVMEHLVTWRVR